MTPGKELFYASFVVLCLSCLGNLAIVARIQSHIKRRYPDIWRSFGDPPVPTFAVMGDQGNAASPLISAFLQSKRRRALQDETLDRLIRLRRRVVWVAAVAFVASGVLIFVAKP